MMELLGDIIWWVVTPIAFFLLLVFCGIAKEDYRKSKHATSEDTGDLVLFMGLLCLVWLTLT
jgi:hypothetical protein